MAEYTPAQAALLLGDTEDNVRLWCRYHKTVKHKQRYFLTDEDLNKMFDGVLPDPSLLRSFHGKSRSQNTRGTALRVEIQEASETSGVEGMGEECDRDDQES